jgi:hypothetical protein
VTSTRNRVVVLAVLVTALVACALVSRKPTPETLQGFGEAANSPAAAGLAATERSNGPAEPRLGPPEPTTFTVTSRTSPREVRLPLPIPVTGERLVLELQRELKRVGCYSREINGEWTPTTRKAMKDFMDRVNAVLPLDAPDAVLLALLKGHARIACGTSCPAGQSLAKDDRCLPSALLSIKPKKTEMTEVAPPSSPTPAAAPVASARRSVARRSTAGSGFFGFLGW